MFNIKREFAYKPFKHDVVETLKVANAINPASLPSGLLSAETLNRIKNLTTTQREMYWWFQALVDEDYKQRDSKNG